MVDGEAPLPDTVATPFEAADTRLQVSEPEAVAGIDRLLARVEARLSAATA